MAATAGLVVAIAALALGQPAVETAGLVAVYAAGGVPAALRAGATLWRRRILDIDLLMVLAAVAAAAVGEPLEGAILLVLFSIAGTLEHHAMGRARRAVEALMDLRPAVALRRTPEGGTEEVAAAALRPGDVVVVRPGARVPVDGIILSGRAALDESAVTGESLPVSKSRGAQVFEATVNLDGVLDVEARRSAEDSTVARMVALVTEAQAAKAPAERFSAWFGQRYTVGVLAGSLVALGVLLAIGRGWDDALYRAATLLVAASPCAIVISVPAAILSALSAAARGGVLFKGGAALETLGAVRQFAFDKTGTLTTGKAGLSAAVALDGDETTLLARLAGLEAQSEHPSAAAIRAEARRRGIEPLRVDEITSYPSEGIAGRIAGQRLWAGNIRMAARMGAPADHPALAALNGGAQSVILAGLDDRLLGAVAIADAPRDSARAGIAALRDAGIGRIVMLTGDRRAVAERIGAGLGFRADEIAAGMLPEQKLEHLREMRKAGPVAFVGDGVNDAAGLAGADVGIAMGVAGSEVALEAADVALMSDDLSRLAQVHALARRTNRVIRQNLVFAVVAMIVLVIGALFFDLPLPLAVIGHEGGTLLVVLNGLRLLAVPVGSPAPHT
ncbi:MAG: heavy metal translocating P-type ATPase [Gemmobacter sp.]